AGRVLRSTLIPRLSSGGVSPHPPPPLRPPPPAAPPAPPTRPPPPCSPLPYGAARAPRAGAGPRPETSLRAHGRRARAVPAVGSSATIRMPRPAPARV